LSDRAGIADTSTRGLSTACWVVDGLRSRSRISAENAVNDGAGGAIAWRGGGFTGTKDVDGGTAAFLHCPFERDSNSTKAEKRGCKKLGMHFSWRVDN
jgi:hypothetical protein